MRLVLGLDIGGTASRAVVTTIDGTIVGRGRADAGNPITVAPGLAAEQAALAARTALSGVDPASVAAAILGIAGTSRFADDAVAGEFRRAFAALGLRCPVDPVGDVVVAFAAGTDRPDGTVLIAGTGAIAAEITGRSMGRTADGHGWLLGDLGSGFWLGREAAAVTARALAHDETSPLVRSVIAAVLGPRPATADAFVTAVHAAEPRALARLAPLVEAAAPEDRLAREIIDTAAGHLTATVVRVRPPHDPRPLVLSGSVLRHATLIRSVVLDHLAARWPDADLIVAGDGELGAARLAVAKLEDLFNGIAS